MTGSYGNFNRVRLQGAVQAPLVDGVLAVRVAALYVHDTGVLENVTPGLGDLDQTDVFAFRGALQFEPSDSFEATLRYNHVKSGGRNYAPFAGNIDLTIPQFCFPVTICPAFPDRTETAWASFKPQRPTRPNELSAAMGSI